MQFKLYLFILFSLYIIFLERKWHQKISEKYYFYAIKAPYQVFSPHNIIADDFLSLQEFSQNSITHLKFQNSFNSKFELQLSSLTILIFGSGYDQPLSKFSSLPNLSHLTLRREFNKPIGHLPLSITHLTFGEQFNKEVIELPQSITHLSFGKQFNQPVDTLPSSLTHLTFRENFNQPLTHLLYGITFLSFTSDFN